MDDKKKSKEQLIAELEELRKKSASQDSLLIRNYLFENAVVGIGVSNQEGHIIESNEAMRNMMGYNEKELLELNLADTYFDSDDRNKILEIIKQDGKVENHETQLINKKGNT